MTLLINLLLRMGLGQKAATIAIKLLALLVVSVVCYLLYHFIWAGPQAKIGQLQQQLDTRIAEIATCQATQSQWQAGATACSTATAAAAAAGKQRTVAANQAADAAKAAAKAKKKALLAGHGPEAMSQFYREVYQ